MPPEALPNPQFDGANGHLRAELQDVLPSRRRARRGGQPQSPAAAAQRAAGTRNSDGAEVQNWPDGTADLVVSPLKVVHAVLGGDDTVSMPALERQLCIIQYLAVIVRSGRSLTTDSLNSPP
jgi:hypothetical protein